MKNILFLDINGVIQPAWNKNRFEKNNQQIKNKLVATIDEQLIHENEEDVATIYYDWDKNAIELVKQILDKHNANIVVSSMWRYRRTIDKLKTIFKIHQLDTYIVDKTEILENNRPLEIQAYLDKNKDINKYAIIDDLDYGLSLAFPNNFVWCSKGIFAEEEFIKTNKIFSKP